MPLKPNGCLILAAFSLCLFFQAAAQADTDELYQDKTRISLEVILDASNSMNELWEHKAKLDLAKNALSRILFLLNPRLSHLGFRAFGFHERTNNEDTDCADTALLVPLGSTVNTDQVLSAIKPLRAYGKTPIARSLRLAGEDLKTYGGSHPTILLITDGRETCGEDPVAVVQKLKEQGLQIEVHIMGMDIDETGKNELKSIAKITGGEYYAVDDENSLNQSLGELNSVLADKMETEKQKFVQSFTEITGGPSLQNAVPIKPGKYRLSERLPIGKRAYFFAQNNASDLISVFGVPLKDTGTDDRAVGDTRYTVTLYGAGMQKLINRETVFLASRENKKRARYFDRDGKGVYFSIGDDFNAVEKNSWFEVGIRQAGDNTADADADTPADAPDHAGTEAAAVGWDEEVKAYLGLQDAADVFLVRPPADSNSRAVRFSVYFTDPEFQFDVQLLDPRSGLPLKNYPVTTGQGTFDLTYLKSYTGFWVQIQDKNPAEESRFSSYKFKASFTD